MRQQFLPRQLMQLHPLIRYGMVAIAVFLLTIGSMGRQPALASQVRHYTELEFPPLPEIEIPAYDFFTLDNGLQVYLMEDHELPLVSGTALVRTGGRFEPADKVGLAAITGNVMRSGGSVAYPADDLNAYLESHAASIETGISTASGSASFSSLTEDLTEVMVRFADVIQQPLFPQDKLDLALTQFGGDITRRNDDPEDVASREFRKLIYGEASPYARTVEYSTLANISRDDLVAFYQESFRPDQMMLGINGDFDPVEMRSLIETYFGDWQPPGEATLPQVLPEVSQHQKGGIFFIDQPQLTQSSIQLGHLGGRLDAPDFAALSVMNEVLNGLGGRLTNEVRSRQGLAYSVYSFWSARYDYPGIFIGGGQTRSDATVPFIQSTLAELEKIRTTPVTAEELAQAQDSVLNSFVFNFERPAQTLSRVMRYAYYDYPEDFIFQYQQAIADTTVADIQTAAATHLNPDNMVVLVVGNEDEIQPELAQLRPDAVVTAIDISIPNVDI
ncbi:MAG: insulinase family protein [Cyanothece sp. SIO2G6]|nr:insulinase family protein [Cyanothece sp. SIO2G6]